MERAYSVTSDASAPDGTPSMQLSELTKLIEGVIKESFRQRYWVVADVTSHKFYESKRHHYFQLVEKGERDQILAQASVVAWKNGHRRISKFERTTGQRFTNGISVLVAVTVDYHRVHGLKLTLQDISHEFTLGKLQQQKEDVLARLLEKCGDFIQKDGDEYWTRNKSLRLRPVLQKIAVIGASNSAGMEDFRHSLEANDFGYGFEVDPYPCKVQGEGGAEIIARRLVEVFNTGKPYDAVVILRGGGSQSDFLIFDQFVVGRVVAKFPIPIITGLGHQKDQTVADLMAHVSTKTPTKVAEYIIARNRAFEEGILKLQNKLIIRIQHLLSARVQGVSEHNSRIVNTARTKLANCKDETTRYNRVVVQCAQSLINYNKQVIQDAAHRVIARPNERLRVHQTELAGMKDRLTKGSTGLLKHTREYLGHHASVVRLASPDNILKRGFAIVKIGERIIVNHDEIAIGDRIRVIFASGGLTAKVEKKAQGQ